MSDSPHFLPYQRKWLSDDADIKVWEKSRRIGATYVQAWEDVRDVLEGNLSQNKVWFSSADESAAKEYIDYCAEYASMLNAAVKQNGEVLVDEDKDVKALQLELPNGTINALTSNPRRFRSKGGKAVWDEAAWHNDQEAMWDAMEPVTMWGDPLRVLSTHNGKRFFHKLCEDVKDGRKPGSVHVVTVIDAVADGLLDAIMGRTTTEKERREWLENRRARCRDEEQWLQEYMCTPVDETDAFLPYDMIATCEDQGVLWSDLHDDAGDLYLGMDIGRKKDLSVIWVVERVGPMLFTRVLRVLEKMPFRTQRDILYSYLEHPSLRRACIDATGLGMQLAEEAQFDFGRYRVEPITFTSKWKEESAYAMRRRFEDTQIVVPSDQRTREDLHSVKRSTTSAGNVRFDVAGGDGHADRFWACALAVHAVSEQKGPVRVGSRNVDPTSTITSNY